MKPNLQETILLTQQDYERMIAACEQAPNPSAFLIEAAQRYKERVKDKTKAHT